eukprot:SAG11_NODE_1755_length_4311_cov_3.289411_3_plen_114_part_00
MNKCVELRDIAEEKFGHDLSKDKLARYNSNFTNSTPLHRRAWAKGLHPSTDEQHEHRQHVAHGCHNLLEQANACQGRNMKRGQQSKSKPSQEMLTQGSTYNDPGPLEKYSRDH